jgi:CHAT domain-containing protein
MLLAPGASADGALEAREIMNLDLRAAVTVFSDGAAMTMMDAADETGAVAWAWRAAGVRAMVLPRWRGDDAASNAFLAALHARLRAGDAPEAALRAARVSVRASPGSSAPYFWAGWMLVGGP